MKQKKKVKIPDKIFSWAPIQIDETKFMLNVTIIFYVKKKIRLDLFIEDWNSEFIIFHE